MENNILQTYKLLKSLSFKRASSDVMTPIGLAIGMVDKIPSELHNTPVLVPGSGYGTFAMALIHRGWDPSNITCVELDKAFALVSKTYIGRLGVKVIQADFLFWQPNMQFDVVIGNPPYQNSSTNNRKSKLWPLFIKKGTELLKPNGFISLITPISWATFDTRTTIGQRKRILSEIDVQAVTDQNKFFSVGVDIAQWCGVKRPYSGMTEMMGETHDLSQGPWYYPEKRAMVPIHDKVLSFHTHLPIGESNHLAAKDCTGGDTPIYVSGTKLLHTNLEVKDVGVPKLVAPFSSSPRKRFHTTEAVGMFNPMMPCSKEEFSVLTKIWDLKVVRFFLETWSKTAGFTPGIFKIPDLRGMGDDQAYEALGLTADEVKLVEEWAS